MRSERGRSGADRAPARNSAAQWRAEGTVSAAATMQAALLTGHGDNEVVAVGPHPKPQRRPGEVLVRMKAASVNRVDLYMRTSGAGITHTLPQVMGVAGAGIVEEADAGDPWLAPGRPVVLHPCVACGRRTACK